MALRLALWYTATAFVVLSATVVYLNIALVRTLDREDDQFLFDKLEAVRRSVNANRDAIPEETRRGTEWLFVRVMPPTGKATRETPGMATILPPSLFPMLNAGETITPTREYFGSSGQEFRLMTGLADDGVTVIHVAINQEQDEEIIGSFRQQSLYAVAACLLLIGLGSYAIAKRGVKPIADVTATAKRIRPGAMNERISTATPTREAAELAATFNDMLDRLDAAMTRLTRFSGDIAHELRTPLNRLTVGSEIALTRARTVEEYQDALAGNLDECRRLTKLIDSLLFLARADDPKTEIVRKPLDLRAELQTLEEFYAPAASEKGIKLIIETQAELTILGDQALLRQAFGNLIHNALAHTPPGGTITLFAHRAGDEIVAGVRDTGTGIPPEHLPHIFDRFYRADPAREPSGRVGLGLAIVRGILELHETQARVMSSPAGTTIEMRFRDVR
jgi:two-component system, OmpR family, heavy metal sensor histidine kinase CusS